MTLSDGKAPFALYARVSKAEDQTTENQLIQLRQWAEQSGQASFKVFEEALSSRDTRPAKEEVLRGLRLGTLSGVAVVSLSRWGRSLSELARELEEFQERGIVLVSLKEGLRFDTAAGKMYAGILAVFAQFERDLVRERTLAGLARARAQGKVLGWPKGKPRGPPANRGGHAQGSLYAPITSVIGSRRNENPSEVAKGEVKV